MPGVDVTLAFIGGRQFQVLELVGRGTLAIGVEALGTEIQEFGAEHG